jgi:hypothetical protein
MSIGINFGARRSLETKIEAQTKNATAAFLLLSLRSDPTVWILLVC